MLEADDEAPMTANSSDTLLFPYSRRSRDCIDRWPFCGVRPTLFTGRPVRGGTGEQNPHCLGRCIRTAAKWRRGEADSGLRARSNVGKGRSGDKVMNSAGPGDEVFQAPAAGPGYPAPSAAVA